MAFKDFVDADMDNVFLNEDEFAEIISDKKNKKNITVINGRFSILLLDEFPF